MPRLMVRDKYDVWQTAGRKRAEERARDRVGALLASHRPTPLPGEVLDELQAIYAAACRAQSYPPGRPESGR
jgi:trimethylamine:corrinoid methyltransferase-like protein